MLTLSGRALNEARPPKPWAEAGVQNWWLCVYWCMDNAEVVEVAEQNVEKKKSKKDKVRSAWISFAAVSARWSLTVRA